MDTGNREFVNGWECAMVSLVYVYIHMCVYVTMCIWKEHVQGKWVVELILSQLFWTKERNRNSLYVLPLGPQSPATGDNGIIPAEY